jgi:hypothetical protein
VSKNSDAIKKALDAIAADLGEDEDDDDDEEGDVAEVDISDVRSSVLFTSLNFLLTSRPSHRYQKTKNPPKRTRHPWTPNSPRSQ